MGPPRAPRFRHDGEEHYRDMNAIKYAQIEEYANARDHFYRDVLQLTDCQLSIFQLLYRKLHIKHL